MKNLLMIILALTIGYCPTLGRTALTRAKGLGWNELELSKGVWEDKLEWIIFRNGKLGRTALTRAKGLGWNELELSKGVWEDKFEWMTFRNGKYVSGDKDSSGRLLDPDITCSFRADENSLRPIQKLYLIFPRNIKMFRVNPRPYENHREIIIDKLELAYAIYQVNGDTLVFKSGDALKVPAEDWWAVPFPEDFSGKKVKRYVLSQEIIGGLVWLYR